MPDISQKYGFVVYMLSYKEETDWLSVKSMIEADIGDWGEGVAGVDDDIRGNAKLQWMNGKDLGIPEGDVEAARR
jgi:hypothetical protein